MAERGLAHVCRRVRVPDAVRGRGVSVPVKLYAEHGLIAVRLPPGRQRLSLRFQPSHITIVFAITLVAAVGLVTPWLVDL